jgi:mannose-6-phosphate isomerase-like protein (cupin superfamily)
MHARPLRFLDTHVIVHVRHDEGTDGTSIIESRAPFGDSPPLHVHHTEDESFCVLAGELRLRVGDDELVLGAGACASAPRGVPHTYRVESREGARWLVVTANGDFERFVLGLARPVEGEGLPDPSGPPSPEQASALAEAAAAHGIELVGPPLG